MAPVPASRIRVGRWGAYYGKNYKAFRKQVAKELENWAAPPIEGPIHIQELRFHCPQPKTTKRAWPRGDLDNYQKSIFDAMNGIVWVDDDQIVRIDGVIKDYAKNGKSSLYIRIMEMTQEEWEPNEITRALLDQHTQQIYGIHLDKVTELIAAFIVRNRCDPDDAEVITEHGQDEQGKWFWRSYIRRRPHGRHEQGTMPSVS